MDPTVQPTNSRMSSRFRAGHAAHASLTKFSERHCSSSMRIPNATNCIAICMDRQFDMHIGRLLRALYLSSVVGIFTMTGATVDQKPYMPSIIRSIRLL